MPGLNARFNSWMFHLQTARNEVRDAGLVSPFGTPNGTIVLLTASDVDSNLPLDN